MTADHRLENADAIRWARHSLRIDDVDAASSVADLLRRVAEREYVVPPEAAAAVLLLANPEGLAAGSNIAALAKERGRDQRLKKDVTDFANVFFDLAPRGRTERWQTLMNDCRDRPAMIQWLSDLRPGLIVILMPSSSDEHFNELVNECREIFVMRRLAGIRRRQEFVAMCREDHLIWELAAQKLQSEHPFFTGNIATWIDPLTHLQSSDRDERNHLQQLTRRSPNEVDDNSLKNGRTVKEMILGCVDRVMRSRKTMSWYAWLYEVGYVLVLCGLFVVLKGGLGLMHLIYSVLFGEPVEESRKSTKNSQQ